MIRLSFVGDVMCEHTRLDSFRNAEGAYDFAPLFAGVEEEFRRSDLVVANLETPLAGEALGYSRKNYSFNTPEQMAFAMKHAGVHAVSTANNHVLDRGVEGLEKTLETLDAAGLLHTGSARTEEEAKPITADVRGVRIGLLSYTYGTEACYNGHYLKPEEAYRVNLLREQELRNPVRRYFAVSNRFFPRALRAVYRRVMPKRAARPVGELRERDGRQKERLLRDIAYAKEHSDFTVLCLHCGGQFNEAPTKYTEEIADFCLDHGADAVVGNHEHRIQISRFGDFRRPVAYCLGNFTSDYGIDRKPFDKNADCSVLLHLYLDEETKKLAEIGFGILISVRGEDGVIVTKLLSECAARAGEDAREALAEKNTAAVNAFLGTDFDRVEPREEYLVSQMTGRTGL